MQPRDPLRRRQNKTLTIKGKQGLAKLGDAKIKITFEDVEMQLKIEDAVKAIVDAGKPKEQS